MAQSAFPGTASAAAALGMGDAFHIDDLLDFSNEDIAGPIGEGFQLSSLDSTVTTGAETVSCTNTHTGSPGVSLGANKHPLDPSPNDHHIVVGDVLCVPCDDIADLEWLSKFVEDSFSMGETPTRPSCNDDMQFESSYNSCKDRFQRASPVSVLESSASSASHHRVGSSCINNNNHNNHSHHHNNLLYRELSVVPGRARSKRARTGGRVWGNSRILAAYSASTTDTESLSSDSNVISGGGGGGGHNSSSSAFSADSSHHQHQQQQQHSILLMMTPPPKAVTTVKKPWKPGKSGNSSSSAKKGGQKDDPAAAGGGGGAAPAPWRCLHCATQRTPQWRAGPMGPKTLCNACGVRYKSGRLLPEYRPAGSPGYVGHKHSNSHKKILEMRRHRETSSSSSPHHQPPPPPPPHLQHQQLSQFSSPPVQLDDDSAAISSEN